MMGQYWMWVCDELREKFEPNNLKRPEWDPRIFELVQYGAWVGKPVRLVTDVGGGQDEYYRLDETYRAAEVPELEEFMKEIE